MNGFGFGYTNTKMVGLKFAAVVLSLAAVSALPTQDAVFSKFSEGLRYDYLEDDAGQLHLVDNWLKMSDLQNMARYDPDNSNRYMLFTRANPWIGQRLVLNDLNSITNSNYNRNRRTIVLIHGFAGGLDSQFNRDLLPAFLGAQDLNVIILDWSAGSFYGPLVIQAAQAAGRFFTWLNDVTGGSALNFHIVGYSVGGHGAAIAARTTAGSVGYVTGCDPADRWDTAWLFRADDAIYTEVIHTNIGNIGHTDPLAQVDFYPNGGRNMPGCLTALCDHYRSYGYLAESIRTGGFTGQRCNNLQEALNQNCNGSGTLRMGGIAPKPGSTGIFHLTTNPLAPFSRG